MSWPAEIDVFLAVGELALYVAYLDGWPARQRIWPWATALTSLAVSIAGNVGHIQAGPGHPVILADRVTAATSPIAAFAGLSIGLLVLKMIRQYANGTTAETSTAVRMLARHPLATGMDARPAAGRASPIVRPAVGLARRGGSNASSPDPGLLADASAICQDAGARGQRLSQRTLARRLRSHGHLFPNDHLHWIAERIGLAPGKAA